MLTRNELKYIATKMANDPNLPVFRNFDGGNPMPTGLELLQLYGTPEAKAQNEALRELLKDTGYQYHDQNDPNSTTHAARGIRALDIGLPKDPSLMDKMKGYLPSIGMGAGAGAVAGIPVALLAHALTGDSKKKNLRSYLKASLLGALLGGGLGAGGGALYKALGIGEPTMSETPLGLHNRVYKPVLDSMKLFDPSKVDTRSEYEKSLPKEELEAMRKARGFK